MQEHIPSAHGGSIEHDGTGVGPSPESDAGRGTDKPSPSEPDKPSRTARENGNAESVPHSLNWPSPMPDTQNPRSAPNGQCPWAIKMAFGGIAYCIRVSGHQGSHAVDASLLAEVDADAYWEEPRYA